MRDLEGELNEQIELQREKVLKVLSVCSLHFSDIFQQILSFIARVLSGLSQLAPSAQHSFD